jgi:DNA-binding transcriptional LysR family regulator
LFSGRADLVIGAPSEAPPEHGAAVRPLGDVQFVFAIAPDHPLAQVAEPIRVSDILQHRIVVAADTSRSLPPRSVGLSNGQDTLTVPTMQAKLDAQIFGLGVGFLPLSIAAPAIAAGRLVRREVEEETRATRMSLAWRPRDAGKGLRWWLEKLEESTVRLALLA